MYAVLLRSGCIRLASDWVQPLHGFDLYVCPFLLQEPSQRHQCLQLVCLSRCSKLFYTFSRCYFYIESAFSGASISFVLSHIARYVPSPEENSCIPITHFQCKNNFEHLLIFRSRQKSPDDFFFVSEPDQGFQGEEDDGHEQGRQQIDGFAVLDMEDAKS